MAQLVAVVTGSNKGIGFAIVRALCKQLDNGVVYLTSRNEERGKEAMAKLNQEGLQPKFHQLDVTDRDSVRKLRDFLKETHGGLDILINNAGIAFKRDATESFAVQASVTMATNFSALLDVNRTFIPLTRSHGRIVNIASYNGRTEAFDKMSKEVQARFQAVKTEQDVEKLMQEYVALANAGDHSSKGWPKSAYATASMGVIALTKVQAANIAKDNTKEDILLISACPGFVATDMSSHKGHLTIDQGAENPVYCALLPPGSQEYQGKMFSEKKLYEFW